MRIALVLSSLGGGGTERVAAILADHWSDSGEDVVVITLGSRRADTYHLRECVRRIDLNMLGQSMTRWSALFANFARLRALRRTLEAQNPDVVVSLGTAVNVLVLLASIGSGLRIVVSERVDPLAHELSRSWTILRKICYRRAAMLVIQTKQSLEWASSLIHASRVRVIPNPLSPGSKGGLPSRSGDAHVVMGCGRLVPQKGFDLLIDAFATSSASKEGWRLDIYGEGPEKDALADQIDSLGMGSSISLQGFTTGIREAMALASVFVLSSRYEGFPNVLLEAMDSGMTVIAFDCPTGPAEIITCGADGFLVPVGDIKALANSITLVTRDTGLRRRFGAAAELSVRRFDPCNIMALWSEALSAALGAHQNRTT